MNQRKFAFSWGRKIFFGISWPLSLLVGLLYLRSFILPQSFQEVCYYLLNWVGHFGLLNAIVYYLLFCPVILLMPTYYVTRFWSLFLVIFFNLLIFLDALSFTSFSYHLDSFVGKLLLEEGIHHILGLNAYLWIMAIVVVILSGLLWFRGEIIWRKMQARFSNPVSNWYFLMIVLFIGITRLIYHTGSMNPLLTELFPLNFQFSPKSQEKGQRKLFYPSGKVVCTGKKNPNIVFFVMDVMSEDGWTSNRMPVLYHMKKHAVHFLNHQSVSSDIISGRFSFFYSIPASYSALNSKVGPVFFNELSSRQYQVVEIDENADGVSKLDKFRGWIENLKASDEKPFYLSFRFKEQPEEVDTMIRTITLELEKKDLLTDTEIIFTGAWSGEGKSKIPLMLISSSKKSQEVYHITTPYDVIPSLMENFWGCKRVFKAASIGKPLDKEGEDWLLVHGGEGIGIKDLVTHGFTLLGVGKVVEGEPPARRALIFPALRKMNQFTSPN
jgi:membrane-anchored protein YejM (alkaline phosphatase superfamily)